MILTADAESQSAGHQVTIQVTPEMIEAGVAAVNAWAIDLGVEDVPAPRELVLEVLKRSLSRCRLGARCGEG